MPEENKDSVYEALVESNDLLQEEITRLRNGQKVLRSVIRALRATLTTYRKLLETAKYNDEAFKALCEGEFDPPVALTEKGGLPKPESRVESTVRNGEEASENSASC